MCDPGPVARNDAYDRKRSPMCPKGAWEADSHEAARSRRSARGREARGNKNYERGRFKLLLDAGVHARLWQLWSDGRFPFVITHNAPRWTTNQRFCHIWLRPRFSRNPAIGPLCRLSLLLSAACQRCKAARSGARSRQTRCGVRNCSSRGVRENPGRLERNAERGTYRKA